MWAWVLVLVLAGLWLPGSTAVHPYPLGTSCDTSITIAANESFPILGFPPPSDYHRVGYVSYGGAYGLNLPPRNCTWTFKGADGDCALQLVTSGYERGDIDCGHQQLLIGDNDSKNELRICGFKTPPALFVSSGRELFLTHFQRNGAYETVSSVLRGVVVCSKRSDPTLTCGQAHFGPLASQVNRCSKSGDCVANVGLRIFNETVVDSTTFSCTAPTGQVCRLTTNLFQAFVSSNQTCVAPLPEVPATSPNCRVIQHACVDDGSSCHMFQTVQLNSVNVQRSGWGCTSLIIDTLCSLQLRLCFDIVT